MGITLNLTRVSRRAALLGLLLAWFGVLTLHAQDGGNVAGVVVSTWDGTSLAGATVTVRGTTLAAQTGANGQFELKNVPVGDQELRFSKSGYAAATVTEVRVLPGQTTTVSGNLRPEFYDMEEYEVTAEEFQEQTEQIMFDRQGAAGITLAIGSDTLSRMGSSDAADAVTKVSGSTIVDGKYAVVRGLNDRYVPTTMNGAVVPSSDPYRRAASLDQFPTAIIEQVAITKTFTPDQPGDFTGGGVNVITKRFPEDAFVVAKVGVGYNTQSTGNSEFLTYKGGGTDWLGMDDGTRAIPDEVAPGVRVPPAGTITPPPTAPAYNQLVQDANTLNAQTEAMGTTQFEPHKEAPPPDHKLGLSVGETVKLFNQPLGVLGAFDYRREYRFQEDGTQRRYQGTDLLRSEYSDDRSLTTVSWAGMASAAVRLGEQHEIGVDFLFSQTAQDTARIQTGTNYTGSPDSITVQDKIQWLENNLTTLQLRGRSVIEALNRLEVDYLVAGTTTTQEEPNTRFFNYVLDGTNGSTGGNFLPNPQDPTRYFSSLDGSSLQGKLDLTLPIDQWSGLEAKIKGGLNAYSAEREFWERNFTYDGEAPWVGGDPNTYLTEDNLGYAPTPAGAGRTRWNWQRYITSFSSDYEGTYDVNAAYLMTDLPLAEQWRFVGGARAERTDIQIDSFSFLPSSITGERANSTQLQQTDVLPALGLIWSVRDNMNIRASFSETVARPSFRELAAYRSYDPNLDVELEGNPLLEMSSIVNYDLSWDWFPRPGSLVGVAVFYKDLTQPIEQKFITLDGSIMSWENRDAAEVMGIEFELRQSLDVIDNSLRYFSLGGNLALIKSITDLTEDELILKRQFIPGASDTRPLSEQSPYILNVDATYANPIWGTTLSLVFNITGPRLLVSALTTDDIYEQPTPLLDLIASQRVGKNVTLRFAAKNILNPTRELTYGEDIGLIFSSYTSGTTFQLGLDVKF
jgi:outer membrane receptor protein involved in Fe transport